jgi:hypothetical protein
MRAGGEHFKDDTVECSPELGELQGQLDSDITCGSISSIPRLLQCTTASLRFAKSTTAGFGRK